ncbi:MAG TPA: hypothetical protein PKN96_11860 [Flavobacterium sp.]|uniref:lipocalin family protein n=1 Tax=Flavobacterium sp. TaxID=239 RepID=UPI002BB4CD08|nr:lipocalin family protein [Flavobacterium sp.]HNP33978.1 hypothetical protein [Flavobacterium sp.]
MKRISLLLFFIVLTSCHSGLKKDEIKKLNGYWEIQKVTLANGEHKDYKVNETIDYFEVKSNEGFRQKVMPQFDGKFRTNDIKSRIKIVDKDDAFFIEYNTNYGKWQEEIITLQDSTLVLKNKENVTYTYKKFKPFSFK